jgi:putative PIN family toxin of toxin-antitoxin system
MSPASPAVIDTNVVVSGLLTRLSASPTVRILDGMLSGRFHFLLSLELLAEYREVLLRPKIRTRHRLSEAEVDAVLTELAANGAVVELATPPRERQKRSDEHVWALLAAAPGAVLVTGDRRLIEAPTRGARIVTARAFADSLEETK